MEMAKTLRFVKVRCECGHVNLIPVYEAFHVFEPIQCEQCGKTIAKYEEAP